MRPLRIRCPNPKCRVILSIPPELRAQRVKCAGCGQSFSVPVSLARQGESKTRYRQAG